MVYMGSKAKYASSIVPLLQKIIDKEGITQYIEPFVGGANIIDKIHCDTKIGYDKSYALIALHQQAQKDIAAIPQHGDSDWWYTAKDMYRTAAGNPVVIDEAVMPKWKIGAIAFLASFSNGGFARGYAKNKDNRDYYNEAYRNLVQQAAQPTYRDIQFKWLADYSQMPQTTGALIYCDPPYEGTKTYGYAFETSFDYYHYWNWVREQSKTNFVVCSEQNFPSDFGLIWVRDVTRTNGSDNNFAALEKLGVWESGLAAAYLK